MFNDYTALGNLTDDVKVSTYTANDGSQGAVAHFSLAVSNPYSKANTATFIPFVAFGKLAQNLAQYNHKGDQILVKGSLQNNNYTDKNGVKRYQVEVNANEIQYLQKAKANQ